MGGKIGVAFIPWEKGPFENVKAVQCVAGNQFISELK